MNRFHKIEKLSFINLFLEQFITLRIKVIDTIYSNALNVSNFKKIAYTL